jgi:hypothetical protein
MIEPMIGSNQWLEIAERRARSESMIDCKRPATSAMVDVCA